LGSHVSDRADLAALDQTKPASRGQRSVSVTHRGVGPSSRTVVEVLPSCRRGPTPRSHPQRHQPHETQHLGVEVPEDRVRPSNLIDLEDLDVPDVTGCAAASGSWDIWWGAG